MTDRSEDDTKKVPPQPQEIPKLEDFEGVLGWVQKKKEESKASGKSWSWLIGLLAAVVVFIALAYAAYTAWKKGREIAKLKHKIDVDEEEKIQAEIDAKKLHPLSNRINELAEKAKKLEAKVEKGKEEIRKLEEERKKLNNKIDKITSWEDVDSL